MYDFWLKEFPMAITICDPEGNILEMNDKSRQVFSKYGGAELIGKNLRDCHPEPSRSKLEELLKSQIINCYTTVKGDKRKLIYQAPWYENGVYKGLVEFIIELPADLKSFIRK